MYLLFVDESGTHGGAHCFVLGGIAVHEDDAPRLQRELDALVIQHLGRVPVNLDEYELHAGEMRNAKKPKLGSLAAASLWTRFPRELRLNLLESAYSLVGDFRPGNGKLPAYLFGVVVDRGFRSQWTQVEREQFAYEVLLNKFDVMLKKSRVERQLPNRGLVIHDRRIVAERDIQTWVSEWRAAAGRVGQLHNLADVPLFADSRATRLLQVADLVAYALYRRYEPTRPDARYVDKLWHAFHREGDVLHGCVHYTQLYGRGDCDCEPCTARLSVEAVGMAGDSG